MRKKHLSIFIVLLMLVATGALWAENTPITKANYELPARFTPSKMKKMVFSTNVDAHWLKHSGRFWYIYETSDGKNSYIVNPKTKGKPPIFDNVKMAAMLTKLTKDPYEAKHLPIESIKFIKSDRFIYFKVPKNKDVLDAEKRQEEQGKKKEKKKEDEKKKKEQEEKEKSEVEKDKE